MTALEKLSAIEAEWRHPNAATDLIFHSLLKLARELAERVELPGHEGVMRGFRCEPYGDGTIGCARCGKRTREICETYAEEIAAYADKLAARVAELEQKSPANPPKG